MQGATQNEEDTPIRSLGHNTLLELLNKNKSERGSATGEDIRKREKEAHATYSIERDTLGRKKKSLKRKKRANGRAKKKRKQELSGRKSIKQSSDRGPNEKETKMLKHPRRSLDTSGKTDQERNKRYLRMMNKYNLLLGRGKKPHFITPKCDYMKVRKNIPEGVFHPRSSTTIKRDMCDDRTDDVDDDSNHNGEKNDKFFSLKTGNVPAEIMDGARVPMLGGFFSENEMRGDERGQANSGGENGDSPGGTPTSSLRAHGSSSPNGPCSENCSDAPPDIENTPDMLTEGDKKKESSRAVMSYGMKRNSSTGTTDLGQRSQINESHTEVGSVKLSRKGKNKKDSDTEMKDLHKSWCDMGTTDSIERETTLNSLHSSSEKNEKNECNKKCVMINHPDDHIGQVEKVHLLKTPDVVGKKDFQADFANVVKMEEKDSIDIQTVLRRNEGDMESHDLDGKPSPDSISPVDSFNHEDFIFLDFDPIKEEYVEIKKTLQRYRKKRELTEDQGEKMDQDSNGEDNLEKKSMKEELKDKTEKQTCHQNDENINIKKNFNYLKERMCQGKIRIINYDFERNLCYILVRGDSSL
ncbi:hypothetical protein AK88_04499 [Plasmodium fragile]|uniref:Uncharacterized protein n=1 Tax=Plasmodium fragile TaxID=5857 RepID=A0A0D9QJE2_PLAFR|nr:uncharacterized protein AK88_04499 [Plasmodium fragile]KJP85851.1 hypothetical protein AK88_04499 [Plasmodium fragile]